MRIIWLQWNINDGMSGWCQWGKAFGVDGLDTSLFTLPSITNL
jgi:hypothetical protein